jgi:large subunit ribosomal protein L21e
MVQRIGGFRRKTRSKLSKKPRDKGKLSITKFIATFNEGERVNLKADPSVAKGQYFPRFHGKTGVVTGQRGNCYEVKIMDGRIEKTVIVHPVHLNKVK